MPIVIDASIAIAWLLGEKTLVDRVVPVHWRLEIANALNQSERSRRLSTVDVVSYLTALRELPLSVDAQTGERAWTETLALAQDHLLTVYDAAYLELAQRRALPLASLDGQLAEAARSVGVEVIDGS